MRHLVQVVALYNPPHVGGMEMRARDRAERLTKRDWTVETLTSSEKTYPHVVEDNNLTVRYLKSKEIARTPIIFSLPFSLMKIPKDSIVQVETAIAFCPEITAFICKLRGISYIARVPLDSTGHSKLRDKLLSYYQKSALRWVYKHAARIIVLTEDDVVHISEKYHVDPKKFRIIPNATDFVPVKAPRKDFHKPFRLLFEGRIAGQKNVPLLLESLRYFLDTYALPVHLNIVGDGEGMPTVRDKIKELSLQKYVSLNGFVTGRKVEEYFEDADAFVMSSTHESFPQTLLEAMAKGLPMITSNILGVRTVVKDGKSGILVDLAKESFANAFHRLIVEKKLYQKLANGSFEEAKKYSWDATIDAYLDLYTELQPVK
ncbi:MAG TPA: glycosyltransferase family 4 protein [Candidatus Saccharimonadales bacterium]|nr:glycosyltransferase family 4 protein [Candidatus Saccharimonadales bacterium]